MARKAMRVIYNLNGTIDFLATRECVLGNPSEEEIEYDYQVLDEFGNELHAFKKRAKPAPSELDRLPIGRGDDNE